MKTWGSVWALAAQTEVGDQLPILLDIFALQVAQQTTALPDLEQQATAAVMVFFMNLEVLGQLIDRVREDRDLDLGRTGIVGSTTVFAGDLRLLFFG